MFACTSCRNHWRALPEKHRIKRLWAVLFDEVCVAVMLHHKLVLCLVRQEDDVNVSWRQIRSPMPRYSLTKMVCAS